MDGEARIKLGNSKRRVQTVPREAGLCSRRRPDASVITNKHTGPIGSKCDRMLIYMDVLP